MMKSLLFSVCWAFFVKHIYAQSQTIAVPPPSGNAAVLPLDSVVDVFDDIEQTFKDIADSLSNLIAKKTGQELTNVANCNSIPLGIETEYSVLKYFSINTFLSDDSAESVKEFFTNAFSEEDSLPALECPDGSNPTDSCIPSTQEAAQARAAAVGSTLDEVRACIPDKDPPCCGFSSCVNGLCTPDCLNIGDTCFSDTQCSCTDDNIGCIQGNPVLANQNEIQDQDTIESKCGIKADSEFTPVCVVYNDDMFAIRFLPAFLPIINLPGKKSPCSLIDGLVLTKIPKINLVITFQFIGTGLVFGERNQGNNPGLPNLVYGSSATTGPSTLNPPTLYDGLTNVPLKVDGIDFWISFQLRFISLIKHEFDKAKCNAGFPRPEAKGLAKMELNVKFELYIKASAEEPCVLAVIPSIEAKISILPLLNIGSGLAGYCRVPGDLCVPDGAFINLIASPIKIPLLSGIAEDVFGYDSASTNAGSAGASFGFFLDKTTGEPTGALLRAFVESPKFLGLSLGPSFGIEFQYISNEEVERRRWTITTDKLVPQTNEREARCPAYEECKVWKPYKLVDAQGNEQLLPNGDIKYKDHYICADKLEDVDPVTGVGPFNRQLLARVPQDSDQKHEKNPRPNEWHVQDFFQGYDIFIIHFRLGNVSFGIFRLKELRFTLFVFGDIQPAVNADEDFPDEASRTLACEQAALNDGLFVYMEIEASISLLFLVEFEGRLLLGNIPVTPGSGVPTTVDNPNKWLLDVRAELRVLGMGVVVTATGEWYYVNENRRRRLQEQTGPCVETSRRRMLEDEDFQRALVESVELDDVAFTYDISMTCDSFVGCLEDIGKFVVETLTNIYNQLTRAVEVLIDIAEKAFTELVDFVSGALSYLGLDFVNVAFEELWDELGEVWNEGVEAFDRAFQDGFQFRDLADVGIALAKGAWDTLKGGVNFFGNLLNIGIGRTKGKGRRDTGVDTPYGCRLYVNRVEVCDFCLFSCFGTCSEKDSGDPYPDKECLEQAARDAEMAERLKNETVILNQERDTEYKEDNQGYYTAFNQSCATDNSDNCPLKGGAPFTVTQTIDQFGFAAGSTGIGFKGSTIQGDTSNFVQAEKDYNTVLSFESSVGRRLQGGAADCVSVMVDGGRTMCKDTFDAIQSWYDNDAKEQSAEFAQGTAKGTDSDAFKKFYTEQVWDVPVITFGGDFQGEVYTVELDCDDASILDGGVPTNVFQYQYSLMQQQYLNKPGIEVELAEQLEDANRTNYQINWETLGVEASCLQDFGNFTLSIIDDTGKASNKLNFQFIVTSKPPTVELNGPSEIEQRCNDEPVSIIPNPETINSLITTSGGCLDSQAFNRVGFQDTISTNISVDSCSGYSITRSWSLVPPQKTSETDLENYGDANCSATLAALAMPVEQTFQGESCKPTPLDVPAECQDSPFRIAKYEDLSNGLPSIDILPNGRSSFHSEEYLVDARSDADNEVALIVMSDGTAIHESYVKIVDGSMFVVSSDSGDPEHVSSDVEESFELLPSYFASGKKGRGKKDNRPNRRLGSSGSGKGGGKYAKEFDDSYNNMLKSVSMKHTRVSPSALGGYSQLCNKKIVGFQVDLGGRLGHICMSTSCSTGGPLRPADSLPLSSNSVSKEGQEYDSSVAQAQQQMMIEKLRHDAPRVDLFAKAKRERHAALERMRKERRAAFERTRKERPHEDKLEYEKPGRNNTKQ